MADRCRACGKEIDDVFAPGDGFRFCFNLGAVSCELLVWLCDDCSPGLATLSPAELADLVCGAVGKNSENSLDKHQEDAAK